MDVAKQPSQAAVRAQASVFKLLGLHFDPDKGQFAANWCDETIARQTGVAVEVVEVLRRECFGELKADPEVERLQIDIVALEREAQAFMTRTNASIAEMKGRLLRFERHQKK